MTLQPFSLEFLAWVVFAGIALIVLAGATWLILPSWIAMRLSADKKSSQLEAEDSYRKALAQIIGFPLAILGALGVYVAVLQALATYQQSQTVEYQNQYQRGFEALGSKSTATRIGGLYVLQGLIEPGDSEAGAASAKERNLTLLRALAAFAVEHPAGTDEIVHSDALTALQILAFRKTPPDIGFDLRTGKFMGSVLADDPTKRYADFRNFDLYKADLSGSDLYQAKLFAANLRMANLNGANLAGADLSHAGLSGTTFCPGRNYAVPAIEHDYPVPAEMAHTTFYSSSGEQTRFDGAHMAGAILNDSNFVSPSFAYANLEGTQFANATLDRPDFTGADLKDASFEGAKFVNKPVFDGALLIGTNLHASGVSDEDLRGAHLCKVTGPGGKKLPDDCPKAEQERASRLLPQVATISCVHP
jgi:uncharacterized protein YjbI with pentapeptide repeats